MTAVVATLASQWFTLNADWELVACGEGASALVAQSLGMTLWEAFPGSEEKFRPVFEAGWEKGCASELVYFNSTITDVRAVRRHDSLLVSFDYVTVAGLRATVDRLAGRMAGGHQEHHWRGAVPRPRLRVVRSTAAD